MSLAPIKRKILEHMLLNDKPARATQIAKDSGNEFPTAMMHLLDLTRKGYTCSPDKGQYLITEKGKKILGIPETTKENAKAILPHTPREKAFHFYTGIEKPLNIYAHGLQEFLDKIQKVNTESLEFHVARGDFESWFTSIGDEELAKKMALLKEKKLCGEELRQKLHAIVENRCIALSAMTEKQ
jgi:predicted transcriptional regulator